MFVPVCLYVRFFGMYVYDLCVQVPVWLSVWVYIMDKLIWHGCCNALSTLPYSRQSMGNAVRLVYMKVKTSVTL